MIFTSVSFSNVTSGREQSVGTFGGGGDDVREHAITQLVLALHLDLIGVFRVKVVDGNTGAPTWLHLNLGPGA